MKVSPIHMPQIEALSGDMLSTLIRPPFQGGMGDRGSMSGSSTFHRAVLKLNWSRGILGGTALTDPQSDSETQEASCSTCGELLGARDESLGCLRLHKWSLRVRHAADASWEQNDVENFVCAQLLEMMDAQGVRKFVAYHGELASASSGLMV